LARQSHPHTLPTGTATAVVTDGGNCFNLNSVVQTEPFAAAGAPPRYVASSRGMSQLAGCSASRGTPTNEADAVAGALADWIDSDDAPGPAGAEDSAYAALAYNPAQPPRRRSHRTSRRAGRHAGDLRVGEALAVRASRRDALADQRQHADARTGAAARHAASRPAGRGRRAQPARPPPADGWPSSDAFWDEPAVKALAAAPDTRAQIVEKTRWFRLRLDVELDGAQVEEDALIDAGSVPARLVSRTWGQD
jgi:general secretion pathway protein K